MGTSSTKLIRMIEKHRQVTLVGLLHPNPKNNPSESPLLGLDHGGCAPLEQLDNRLGLPHVTPEEPGMTRSVLTTSWTNPNEQTTKVVDWKGFTQTNSKEIDPKPDDS